LKSTVAVSTVAEKAANQMMFRMITSMIQAPMRRPITAVGSGAEAYAVTVFVLPKAGRVGASSARFTASGARARGK
jgi:hypothetical protein